MTTPREFIDDEFSFTVWPKDGSDDDALDVHALTPNQAAELRAKTDYTGDPDWRASYCVRNNFTGTLYVIDVGVVPQPSFVALLAREVPIPAATHVLWGGHVLCEDKRLRGVPRDWPQDQRWISLQDVADGTEVPANLQCEACFAKAPGLVAGIRQIGVKAR